MSAKNIYETLLQFACNKILKDTVEFDLDAMVKHHTELLYL